MANRLQWAKTPEADCACPLPECGEGKDDEPPPDIQLLRATTFGQLIASEEVVVAFGMLLGLWQGLWGALLDGIIRGDRKPRILNAPAGAAAVVVAEE